MFKHSDSNIIKKGRKKTSFSAFYSKQKRKFIRSSHDMLQQLLAKHDLNDGKLNI